MIKAQCLGFLSTPPLWDGKQFEIEQFQFPDVRPDSFQPEALPQNIRLGHQVEHVFKQLIDHSDHYDILVYNLPIRQEKRTLGEIDFILKDNSTEQLIHVELTYKFYIIDPEITDPIHRLIGPNRRDTFFLKKEKIKNVQFPLLHSEEGAKALYELGIDHHKALEHQCCFKAQLFVPYQKETVLPVIFDKACISGYWLRLNDLNKSDFKDILFYLPSKSEWIIEPHIGVAWLSHKKTLEQITNRHERGSAPMVWMKTPEVMISKAFVVTDIDHNDN